MPVNARVLTVEKINFFSCLSYAPFLSYFPLKTKFENLVLISQKVFKLKPSYLVYWLGLMSR